jgi:hypothetical protein
VAFFFFRSGNEQAVRGLQDAGEADRLRPEQCPCKSTEIRKPAVLIGQRVFFRPMLLRTVRVEPAGSLTPHVACGSGHMVVTRDAAICATSTCSRCR